jgi:hypothetical protein
MPTEEERLKRWKLIFNFLSLLVRTATEVWTRGNGRWM